MLFWVNGVCENKKLDGKDAFPTWKNLVVTHKTNNF